MRIRVMTRAVTTTMMSTMSTMVMMMMMMMMMMMVMVMMRVTMTNSLSFETVLKTLFRVNVYFLLHGSSAVLYQLIGFILNTLSKAFLQST